MFLHLIGILFTLGRICHSVGLLGSATDFLPSGAPPPWHPMRVFGTAVTLLALATCSFYLLGLSASGLGGD